VWQRLWQADHQGGRYSSCGSTQAGSWPGTVTKEKPAAPTFTELPPRLYLLGFAPVEALRSRLPQTAGALNVDPTGVIRVVTAGGR
jgi:hypothetical protein